MLGDFEYRVPERAHYLVQKIRTHSGELIFFSTFVSIFLILNSNLSPYYRFDPANYLVTMWTFWEGPYTGLGLRRPFFIAIPLRIIGSLVSLVTANRVLAILSGLSIAVPMYLLYIRLTYRPIAAIVAAIITLQGPYAGMLNWGYITFLGIFFYFIALWQTLRTAESTTNRNLYLLAISYAAVFYTHQITALFLVVTIAVFTGIQIIRYKNDIKKAGIFPLAGVAGTIFALPVLPVYVKLVSITSTTDTQVPLPIAIDTVFTQFTSFIIKMSRVPLLLLLLVFLSLYGLINLRSTERDLSLSVFAIVIPSFTLLVSSAPARMLYFFPPVLGLWTVNGLDKLLNYGEQLDLDITEFIREAVPLWTLPSIDLKNVVTITLVIVLILNGFVYINIASNAGTFWQTMDEEQAESISWIDNNTEKESIIIASHKSYGWAVEGYAHRNVFEPQGQKSYMKQYQFPTQQRQAEVQDIVFSRHIAVSNGNIRTSFSGPFNAPGNPTFDINTGNYRTFLLLNEERSTVTVNDTEIVNQKLSTAEKSIDVDPAPDRTTVHTTYEFQRLTVRKSVTIKQGTSQAHVSFKVFGVPDNFTQHLTVKLEFARAFPPVAATSIGDGVRIKQKNGFGMNITSTIQLKNAGTVNLDNKASNQNPSAVIITTTEPDNTTFTVSYKLNRPLEKSQVQTHSIPEVLAKHDVDYVTIVREPPARHETNYDSETLAWFWESPYYEQVYNQNGIVIFNVNMAKARQFRTAGTAENGTLVKSAQVPHRRHQNSKMERP